MKKQIVLFVAVVFPVSLFAQDIDEVFQTKLATWFGLDYSETWFIGK